MTKRSASLCILVALLLLSPANRPTAWAEAISGTEKVSTPAPTPVLRIPLRVHVGQSERQPADYPPILEEINQIWLSQAGICFEMEIRTDDTPGNEGLDLWFIPNVGSWNGLCNAKGMMWVRDTPNLGSAAHPARSPAARTAAHELGHTLGLGHRQDSADNLMRSKTYGWQLDGKEIAVARENAADLALEDRTPTQCTIRQGLPNR